MNSTTLRIMCLLACVLGLVRCSLAQGCGVDMTQDYSGYGTYTIDGNNRIYTAVVVDGYATCTPSPDCPCNTATHTPKAYNKLSTVGGWGSGTPGCVTCYLSYQNNQSIAGTPGVTYDFTFAGEIDCSIVGVFWNLLQIIEHLKIASTYVQYAGSYNKSSCGGSNAVNCAVSNACTAATTPPLVSYTAVGESIPGNCSINKWVCATICARINTSDPWSCYLGPTLWTLPPYCAPWAGTLPQPCSTQTQ